MTKGPGTGSRPGHGRYNPKPGTRSTKANPGVRSSGTGRGTTHKGGGGTPPKKGGCCPMVAAVRSARRGQWTLARRYFAMSVRLMAGA